MGAGGSEPARPDRADDPDRQHKLPRDVSSRRRILMESALFWAASGGPADVDPPPPRCAGSRFPVIEADDRAVGNVPFFDDWLVHDRADPYWRAIDGEDRARNIKAPVLLMGVGTIRSCPRRSGISRRSAGRPTPRGAGHPPYRRPVDACRRRAISRRVDRRSLPAASLAPAFRGSIITCGNAARGFTGRAGGLLRHGRECLAQRAGVAAGASIRGLSAQRRTRELGRRRRPPDTRRAGRARATAERMSMIRAIRCPPRGGAW